MVLNILIYIVCAPALEYATKSALGIGLFAVISAKDS